MKEDWKIRHLGFIVSDMDRAIGHYKSPGIATVGPELPIAQSPDGSKLRVRFAQVGSIVLEFFQPFEGESMQLKFLRKHGDGIQHMAFAVSNIDDEVNKLLGRGIKLVFRGDMPTGTRIAYLDTSEIADFLIELVQPVGKNHLANMLTTAEERQKNKNWEIHHLGFIVSDIDKAIELYKSLGVATIGRELPVVQSRKGAKLKARFVQIGSLILEFFQPIEGEDMQSEFFRKHGAGIQHIGFTVADLDAEADALAKNNVKLLSRIDYPTGTHIAYFDTAKIGDVLIELIQPSDKDFLASVLKPA
jgi:methylmalonyl-CoA/ethylmalonyl-CoA epimerase